MMISLLRMMTVVVLCVLFSFLTGGDLNTKVVGQVCTERQYHGHDRYNDCLYLVLKVVAAGTAENSYSYSIMGSWSNESAGKCYGHAACNGNLSPGDCTSCLKAAWNDTAIYCSTGVGAQTSWRIVGSDTKITRSISIINSGWSCPTLS